MKQAMVTTLLVAIVVLIGHPAGADDRSTPHVARALRTCEEVDRAQGMDRLRKLDVLDGGVLEGEAAVAADPEDPRAHLSLFCNLALQVELAGLSWRSFARLQRAKAVIDRAHRLGPDDPDVLTAKGEFLRRLPVVLGGDGATGLRLLRRAVSLRPDHVVARLYLARAMAEDGAPDARAKAYEALAVAKKLGATRELSEAADLLAAMSR